MLSSYVSLFLKDKRRYEKFKGKLLREESEPERGKLRNKCGKLRIE
jgi:hypothetical protein